MNALQQTLEKIFGVPFTQQATLAELRQYHHPNTYCCNAEGELMGIFSSENDYTDITIPADWQQLEYLNLSDNKNLRHLTFEAALPRLQHLDGSDSGLKTLSILAGFEGLQWLDVSRNKLERLSLEGTFPKLTYCDFSGNKLNQLEMPDCPKLQYLYLNDNQLVKLVFRASLLALEILHLKNNKLTTIDWSRGFRQLETLYLQENQIASIEPDFLDNLLNLKSLYLQGNPIQNIAKELFDKDENVLEDIRNTLISLSKGKVENNEVKMILVGNSTVGKTTLEKYLRTGVYEDKENTTHGIQVNKWEPENSDGEQIGLNVYNWDFGGQEYYHATHRLFLSNNAVYCLLWNKTTNVQDIVKTTVYRDGKPVLQDLEHYRYEYWLDNIRHYAPDSPILLVQSRDEVIEAVENDLFEQYGINPKKNYQVCVRSVAEGDQDKRDEFSIFQRQLIQTLQATATKFELGKFWVRIRDEIRHRASLGEYRWSWEEYLSFCQQVDKIMKESEAKTLANYLKEVGLILYYPDYPGIAETVFIKPTWVTDRIYEIFNQEVSDKGGEFDQGHVIKVLKEKGIGQSNMERELLSGELLNLMMAFKLIFSPKDKPNTFFAIQYLPNEYHNSKALERQKKGTPHLGFALYFPKFLPKSVFQRFIAEYGKDAKDEFWKYGIFFTHEGNELEVFAECKFKERIIEVWSQTPDNQVVGMLYDTLFKLSEDNKQIEIAVNGTDFISIEKLEEARELEYPKAKARNGNLVVVKDFDFCFGRGEMGRLGKEKSKISKKPFIFISYAHKDEQYKDELITHLATLKNQGFIEAWHDREIEAGLWDDQIKAAMEKADIFLLLITANFLNSKYISEIEITTAYQKYKAGTAKIFPVICSSCLWELQPVTEDDYELHPVYKREMKVWLGKFAYFPKDGKPIAGWANKDEAYLNVMESLLKEVLQ